MNSFKEIMDKAMKQGKYKISVAAAHDEEVLCAVEMARAHGLADAILIGDKEIITQISKKRNIDLSNYQVLHETELERVSLKAVELVSKGEAQMLMKGLVDTSILLKAVLDKHIGLRTNRILSHVAVFEVNNFDRLIYVSDAGMNIYPDLEAKEHIIHNAVSVAHALGNKCPKVALVCAKEKADEKMPCTIDAQKLTEKFDKEAIKNCIVGGPFGLDNAISEKAAKHKGVKHPIAGKADIIIVPNIEAGNVLYKSLVYFSKCENAGVIMGAKAPIILTSRADSSASKLNAIALAAVIAGAQKKEEKYV